MPDADLYIIAAPIFTAVAGLKAVLALAMISVMGENAGIILVYLQITDLHSYQFPLCVPLIRQ